MGVDEWNIWSYSDVFMAFLLSSYCYYDECSHHLEEKAKPQASSYTQTMVPLIKHSGLYCLHWQDVIKEVLFYLFYNNEELYL